MHGRLSAMKVKALRDPGRYADGGTLYLYIAPGGSKSWVQRLTIDGRRHDLGLGGWPVVSLAEAREAALENRRKRRQGVDPLAERRKVRVPSFSEAAIAAHKALRARWRSAKVAVNWLQQLERHAFGKIGDLRVDRIGRDDLLRVLSPIWSEKPETARRVRRHIKQTLNWCIASGFVETNLAGEAISGALPRLPAVKRHLRAMPYQDVGEALRAIGGSGATLQARLALRFAVLTAARPGEVRGAQWSEIDLEARTWTIPAQRMKANREHRVPLSAAAVDVLAEAQSLNAGQGLIFPSPLNRARPLSDVTLTKVLRDNGLADRATVHGFRSSFRDWCAETGKPREIAEAALAHVVGGTEGAYFRSDLFERRRRLMGQWAAYLTDQRAKVVKLHG